MNELPSPTRSGSFNVEVLIPTGVLVVIPAASDINLPADKLVKYFEDIKVQTRNYFAGNILQHPGYRHLGDASKYPNANQVLDKVFFVGCSPTITEEMIEYVDQVVMKFPND